ncbi:hypothetical protein ACFSCV_12715 [Methylopila henanensis]|uniref:DUF4178 domain-containing protein n=1 Tax=Methylopila henanensis TaxID=873516 RepID=A0ABW4K9X5_9HYPH
MANPTFKLLSEGWNAEPNAPEPKVEVEGSWVRLEFYLNHHAYAASEEEVGRLSFQNSSAWRLGSTNDEGWYLGQCRYSGIAPNWGEFYELIGPDDRRSAPTDWNIRAPIGEGDRHFLFYFRDETFECFAENWTFERGLERVIAA